MGSNFGFSNFGHSKAVKSLDSLTAADSRIIPACNWFILFMAKSAFKCKTKESLKFFRESKKFSH